MEQIDWRLVLFVFNIFQFIVGIVVFCVLKFNDMHHIEENVKDLKKDVNKLEDKQTERHLENVKSINNVAIKVSAIYGSLMLKKDE